MAQSMKKEAIKKAVAKEVAAKKAPVKKAAAKKVTVKPVTIETKMIPLKKLGKLLKTITFNCHEKGLSGKFSMPPTLVELNAMRKQIGIWSNHITMNNFLNGLEQSVAESMLKAAGFAKKTDLVSKASAKKAAAKKAPAKKVKLQKMNIYQ